MFENFSFDTPRSPSITSNSTQSSEQSREVSPCSAISPYPQEYSITDLAADFHRQRLRQDSQIYSQPCDSYANLDDDAGWAVEPEYGMDIPYASRVRSGSTHSFSMSRRRDRQANARLLCSASHHRDIASLVSRMITQQEQCSVCVPSTVASCPLQVDEDADDTADLAPLSRQSSTLSLTRSKHYQRPEMRKPSSLISKDIRLRKDKPRRQKSSDK